MRSVPKAAPYHDIQTPSLCSDNEQENSPDDRPPSTPPTHSGPGFVDIQVPLRGDDDGPEVIDVDMRDDEVPVPKVRDRRPPTPHRQRLASDAFAKRPPVSPMPAASPRRPRPPVRAPRTPAPATLRDEESDEDDEEDPLAIRPEAVPRERASPPKGRKSRSARQNNIDAASGSSRRGTLDEEFRRTFGVTEEGEADDEDLDSGIFVGVGTRSKTRGFLARGGAGGSPVFMGVGYVEGTHDDDEEPPEGPMNGDAEYEEPSPPSRKKKKAATSRGAKRKGKRS